MVTLVPLLLLCVVSVSSVPLPLLQQATPLSERSQFSTDNNTVEDEKQISVLTAVKLNTSINAQRCFAC